MHALMQMRYPLTCQPLDVSIPDSVTFSPSGTPSPPSFTFVNRHYEPLMTSRLQNGKTAMPYHHHQLQQKSTVMPPDMAGSRPLKMTSKKRDFTIDAILGLDKSTKSDKFSPAVSRICDDSRREYRVLSPKPYTVPTATKRQNLTVLFPDSLENDTKGRNDEADVDTRYTLLPTSNSNPKQQSISSQKSPQHHGVGKAKRIRTIFTPEQLERLELEFERQQYMVGPERMYLASALSLTESQVKIWFQNRRIKWRKQHLEMQQARLAQLREAETAESESDPDQASLAKDISPGHWDLMDDRN